MDSMQMELLQHSSLGCYGVFKSVNYSESMGL